MSETEFEAESAGSKSAFVTVAAALAVLCLARAGALAWMWPNSWRGVMGIVGALHAAFAGVTLVLAVLVGLLVLPLSRPMTQSICRIAYLIAEKTCEAAAVGVGVWQAGGAIMPDGFYEMMGVNRTMWVGIGFGVFIANALAPFLCVTGLKSRLVAGHLGIALGKDKDANGLPEES